MSPRNWRISRSADQHAGRGELGEQQAVGLALQVRRRSLGRAADRDEGAVRGARAVLQREVAAPWPEPGFLA